MKVLIAGAGSQGLLLGSFLLEQSYDVTFLGRPYIANKLTENGLTIVGKFGEFRYSKSQTKVVTESDLKEGRHFDLVVTSVKSFSSSELANSLRLCISEKTVIVVFQNGIGVCEIYHDKFPYNPIFLGISYTATKYLEDGVVEVDGYAGKFQFGQVYGSPSDFFNEFIDGLEKSLSGAVISENIIKTLWNKVLFVSSLNPVGALLSVTYGQIAASPFLRDIVKSVIIEAAPVIECQYHHSIGINDTIESTLKKAEAAGDHECSMAQDFRNRKRSEIDFLNGAIVEQGKHNGIQTPTNKTLTLMVKAKEAFFLPSL